MQPHFLGPFAVSDVGTEWTDGRAPTHADTDTDRSIKRAHTIERIAGIHEYRRTDRIGDPPRKFDAPQREIASADRRRALRHADRFESIAADRLIATGSKQERRDDARP